jgi:hypothetical protein
MPKSVHESAPISRQRQNKNMTEFLGKIAHAMKIPKENAIYIDGNKVIKANNKIPGMKLLTQEIRKKLPPLYAQDGKGGKAIAYLKLFTPDSGFTWWITYAELGINGIMWSSGLCRVISQSRSAVVLFLDVDHGYST